MQSSGRDGRKKGLYLPEVTSPPMPSPKSGWVLLSQLGCPRNPPKGSALGHVWICTVLLGLFLHILSESPLLCVCDMGGGDRAGQGTGQCALCTRTERRGCPGDTETLPLPRERDPTFGHQNPETARVRVMESESLRETHAQMVRESEVCTPN